MNTPTYCGAIEGLTFQTPTDRAQPVQVKSSVAVTYNCSDNITPGVDTFRSFNNHVTLSAIRSILRIRRSCLLGEPQ